MSYKDNQTCDNKMVVFARDMFTCQHPKCTVRGMSNLQMAHRIAQTKSNIIMINLFWYNKHKEVLTKKEAYEIIHHPLNLVTSCSKHNSYFNIGGQPEAVKDLLHKIKGDLYGEKNYRYDRGV